MRASHTRKPLQAKDIRALNIPLFLRTFGCFALLAFAAGAAAKPALVATAAVDERRWRQTLPLFGTLTSPRDAELTARVAGLVDQVFVDAGDEVVAGDKLLTLDRELGMLTLDTLKASVAEAQARLDEARRLRDQAESLAARNAVAQTELAGRRSDAAIQAASLQRLRAEAARQRELIARHTVVAPFAGTVRQRLVEPGEYVAQATPVVALVATRRLRMDVAAPQQYFEAIAAGMPVRIRPEALHGDQLEARVDVKVPASDPRARTFLVRIFVDNSGGRLTPGMSARVFFDIETAETVLVAPRDALVREPGGGTRVWVVRAADSGEKEPGYRALERQISVGRSSGDVFEVLSGLSAGDRVVVRGNENLSSGDPVRLVEPRAAAVSGDTPSRRGRRLSDEGGG